MNGDAGAAVGGGAVEGALTLADWTGGDAMTRVLGVTVGATGALACAASLRSSSTTFCQEQPAVIATAMAMPTHLIID